MTVPRPTAVATAPFDYLLTSDNSTLDKYNKIKKRLKETIKVRSHSLLFLFSSLTFYSR